MAFHLARTTQWFALASTLALSSLAPGCAVDSNGEEENEGASVDSITSVNHSEVKRQSIGNCWIYATASWAEALNKSATGVEKNMSESYWTYFHWFEQISNSGASKISTGGHFATALELISRYGVLEEGKFIPGEAKAEMSARQKSANAAIDASLATGALKTAAARRDRALVRRELDKAWGLTPAVVANLDAVFGPSVSKTLDKTAIASGNIMKSSTIKVQTASATTHQPVNATLADVIGTRSGFGGRSGPLAWKEVSYPFSKTERRAFEKRYQKALHDKQPVVMTWFVDFNSLNDKGQFLAPPATPGHQGGHMVVMHDYEIDNVPGFGTLKAGVDETRPAALAAALDTQATIKFIRIKNSWGSFRPDRQFAVPGYHDLHMAYLNGLVARCEENADGSPNTDDCFDDTPFGGIVLPAGY